MNIILYGVVGSTAYGLSTPGSDVDYAGIYAVDTAQLFGLKPPTETYVTKGPDATLHEARKFCALALQCNPSILELLWLGSYEQQSPLGSELIVLRNHFLSAPRVKDAYLGYATQQMKRMAVPTDGSKAERQQKLAKHARHVARLLYQGYQLYRTSTLPVKLPNAVLIREIGEAAGEGDNGPLRRYFNSHEAKFSANSSALPHLSDTDPIEDWLHKVRMSYLPDAKIAASSRFPHE